MNNTHKFCWVGLSVYCNMYRNFLIMIIPVTKISLCEFEQIQSRIEFGNIILKLLCSYEHLDTSDDCILYVVRWQRLQKSKLCAEAAIMDEMMLQRCLQFYSLLADYVLRVADPENKGYIFFYYFWEEGELVFCVLLFLHKGNVFLNQIKCTL